jgi:succinoglycan biosynthesis protein ExoA
VNESLPAVTVLIAARPGQAEILAVNRARQLDYPREKLEIIVARGKQPSVQRNEGMRAARGEIIYFLDDDSLPDPRNLHRAAEQFKDPAVQMVGGPSPCPDDAPFLEQVFGLVHGSFLAFGPSVGRYKKCGQLRSTSEKELILCNLAARKDTMLQLGGFDERLYPNEENALMDELQKRGRLMYDPEFAAHRRPRRSLKSYFKMVLNYGRGRAEQFRLHPTAHSLVNFAPPVFCVYLLCLLLALPFPALQLEGWIFMPLAFYALALLVQAAMLVPEGGALRSLCAVPVIILSHLGYGFGVVWGFFTSLKAPADRPKTQVVLENVPL